MKGYRTIALNGLMIALLLTDYLVANTGVIAQVFSDPKHAALAMIGVNGLNIALRFFTNTPVGKRDAAED